MTMLRWLLVAVSPLFAFALTVVTAVGVAELIEKAYALQGRRVDTSPDENWHFETLMFMLPVVVFAATLPPLVHTLAPAPHKTAADRIAFGVVVAVCLFWFAAPMGALPAAVALLLSAFVQFVRPRARVAVVAWTIPIVAIVAFAAMSAVVIG